jgi:Flp pilus assembly secretin CpaC
VKNFLGRRLFSGSALAAAIALVFAIHPLAPAAAQSAEKIFLETGHSRTVNAPGLTRIAVGDSRIAGVTAIGGDEVLVNGKSPGTTTIFIWSILGRTSYEVQIYAQGLDDIVPVMERAIDEPNVHVRNIGRAVVVSGTVPDGARSQRLISILAQFGGVKTPGYDSATGTGTEDYKIINTVSVERPFGDAERHIAMIPGAKNIHLVGDSKGNVIVSGEVTNRQTAEQVLALARGLAGSYLTVDGKVIDRLVSASNSQVDVRVYVLEIDDTGLKNLGIQLQSATVDSSGNVSYGNPQYPVFENPNAAVGRTSDKAGGALNIGSFVRTTYLAPTLNAILQSGHGRILSQPNLTTLPGVAATILVGGQVPYVYSTGLGAVSILFKDYGVSLAITPTIMGSGAIDCKVAPTVSQLDYSNGVTLSGTVLPALTISQLSTEVVTQPGESIVIGGLIQRVETRTLYKFPVLGDIPVLGKLFRSQSYQAKKTDVVFVMTPAVLER